MKENFGIKKFNNIIYISKDSEKELLEVIDNFLI